MVRSGLKLKTVDLKDINMYKILAKYRGETEEVDTADTLQEAQYLVSEYRMAYGSEWIVWFVKDKE